MDAVGIELNLGAGGASAEELHGAALAHHIQRPLPGFRTAHGFNHHVCSQVLRELVYGGYGGRLLGILLRGNLHHIISAEPAGGLDLLIAFDHTDDAAPFGLGDLDKHKSNRPTTDDYDIIARANIAFVQAEQNTGQGLDHGSFFEAHFVRDNKSVLFDDALWNAYVFGIGAVVEEQIVTQILLSALTVKARAAGSGVGRHHAHALAEVADAQAYLGNLSGQLVSEERRRNNHPGVIATTINLKIGATGECGMHLHQNLAFAQSRNGDLLDLDILFAVENSGGHGAVRVRLGVRAQDPPPLLCFPSQLMPGVMTIFSESGCGCMAILIASTACS